jgi:DNA repair protein RadA/Sms
LAEAAKHGFRRAIVPTANEPRQAIPSMEVVTVSKLSEALAAVE